MKITSLWSEDVHIRTQIGAENAVHEVLLPYVVAHIFSVITPIRVCACKHYPMSHHFILSCMWIICCSQDDTPEILPSSDDITVEICNVGTSSGSSHPRNEDHTGLDIESVVAYTVQLRPEDT